jgi:putative inorganic carbon (HCO3(-)) transporter
LPGRMIGKDLPLSTIVEVLVLFLFIGTYWTGRRDENLKGNLLKSGVTIILIINILYYIIEVFNPNQGTTAGWFFTSKRYFIYILSFVISFRLINTPQRFRNFLKFWIVMSAITAAYGCYQEWFGFLPMELNYLQNDPHEYGLLLQGGVVRKFSFLDGVVTFGSLCGSMAVMTTILAINEKIKKRRYWFILISIILFLGMSYSGTRTFTIMMPAGLALYVMMTFRNKATLSIIFFTILAVVFIMFAPVDNATINRMRSTFDSEDESLNVRNMNRQSIQPYIYTHPLGGGVATSGVEGMRFNPKHRLAGFPPDSGLLKLALDMGWIGLALNMLLNLILLIQGINYYFKLKNEEYKKYIVAITCALFSTMVTLYAQVSIGQMPNVFFYFAMMGLFTRLREFDEKEQSVILSNG